MKKQLKGIGLMGLFLLGAIFANAQSGNSTWIVSKDVQRVSNKKVFESEDLKKSHIQARSVAFPAIVISKGIVRSNEEQPQGNITSKGYPTWAISKGVARMNQERMQEAPAPADYQNKDATKGVDQISKK